MRFRVACLLLLLFASCQRTSTERKPFDLIETTIAEVHESVRAGELTFRELVVHYLDRIRTYDQSTRLNAIVLTNPTALEEAEALDEEFERTGELRPLHGIPFIVKDNYNTIGLQTTAGSLALKGNLPSTDAFQVRKIREAGGIVLAKSNMAEWAFSAHETVSSIAGITRNPYDLSRVPAGSSGGTAAAVAANFGIVGLGTDTGNSIRGPSSHNALVGIRSTMGLTSRAGIVPFLLRSDIGGPMARTVEDAVRVFEVIAGHDPADPITGRSRGKKPKSYRPFLKKNGLKGVRVGLFRRYIERETTDSQVKNLVIQAVKDLVQQGAEVVDPFDLADYEELTENLWCDQFRHNLNQYLASSGEEVPYSTLTEIVESGLFLPRVEKRMRRALKQEGPPEEQDPPCLDLYSDPRTIAFREAILAAMDNAGIDAIICPTWSNPPRKVGDRESPAGDNSQHLSPLSGLPAITVPMGYTYGELPAGLTFVGKLFGEPQLIQFAYAYEQATNHRRPPKRFTASKEVKGKE
jgi:Asp-tRNA(Asn)/Glu-tRNA(Gln) amidotransferase A subunit family amidase